MATTTTTATALAEAPKSSGSQVRVQLSTKQPDISLPDNAGPVLVPTSLRRYGLSTLVNHLLGHEKPTPFDFLISGTFLRTSVDDYLTAHGLSSETVLHLEYVRSLIPPLYLTSYEHDDWVSCVDVLSRTSPAALWTTDASRPQGGQERLLSGSYDGLLRVWNTSAETLTTSSSAAEGGHTASVKAAKFLSPTQIVSAGLDRSIRVWKYGESEDHLSATLTPYLELHGHQASVEDVSVHAPSQRILSASADHRVGLWSSKKSDAPAVPDDATATDSASRSKRRKVSSTNTPQRGPLSLLSSHSAPVSSAIFAPQDATVAYSSSWDHTLRTWDLPTSSLVDTRTTSHSLLSLAALPTLNLLAAGTSARHITLIDPRVSATNVSVMTLRGHTNAVVSLATNPDSAYGLISGSHDGTCRVWDVRSTKPGLASEGGVQIQEGAVGESVYTIERESAKGKGRRVGGEGVKVFGVCWDPEVGIISGGEDKRLQINKGRGMLEGQ
ncbi:MAG: ribosome biogenesis protein ytm1, partial [Piccolia ochrophora]